MFQKWAECRCQQIERFYSEINYGANQQPHVEETSVRLRRSREHQARQVTLHSPDIDESQDLQFHRAERHVRFTVPKLNVHSLVVVEYEIPSSDQPR